MTVRARRACLVVPAVDARKLEKAAGLAVDEVIVDLEDAVPAARKGDEVRRAAAAAVAGFAWTAPTVAVRVNAIGSPWFADDVRVVVGEAGPRLAAIVVPKVESPEDVRQVVEALDAAGAGPGVGIEVQVETALGLVRVEAIAEAASGRLEALVFGAGDYAASMSMPLTSIGAIDPSYPGDQWGYPRARIATAARAFGLEAIDTPFAAFNDDEGLARSARHARLVGFGGKWVIHPAQVATCTAAFTPGEDELAAARRTLGELDEAASGGRGAAASGGTMVDAASRRQALAVLARAGAAPPTGPG